MNNEALSHLTCWLITDDRTAYKRQTSAVIKNFSLNTIQKNYPKVNFSTRFLRQLLGNPFLFSSESQTPTLFEEPWPDIAIASSHHTIPALLAIKQKSEGKTFCIFVQTPTFVDKNRFDLIIAPEHDQCEGPNVITNLGALHDISYEQLEREKKKIPPFLEKGQKKPILGILIGGSTRKHTQTQDSIRLLGKKLRKLAANYPGTVVVTVSRRTGEENIQILQNLLEPQNNVFFNHPFKGENLYLSILAHADALMVTNDSISMISEACFTGKPVYILPLPEFKSSSRYIHFIESLIERKMVRYYREPPLDKWSYSPLNEADRIAPIVMQKILEFRAARDISLSTVLRPAPVY